MQKKKKLLKNIVSLIAFILHVRFQGAAVDAGLQVKSETWARKTNHLSYSTFIPIASHQNATYMAPGDMLYNFLNAIGTGSIPVYLTDDCWFSELYWPGWASWGNGDGKSQVV